MAFIKEPSRVFGLCFCVVMAIVGASLATRGPDDDGDTLRFIFIIGVLSVAFVAAMCVRGSEIVAFGVICQAVATVYLPPATRDKNSFGSSIDRVRAGYGLLAAGSYCAYACLLRGKRFNMPKCDWRFVVAFIAFAADVAGGILLWLEYTHEVQDSASNDNLSLQVRAFLAWTNAIVFLTIFLTRGTERMMKDWTFVVMFYFAYDAIQMLEFDFYFIQWIGYSPFTTHDDKYLKGGHGLCFIGHVLFIFVVYIGYCISCQQPPKNESEGYQQHDAPEPSVARLDQSKVRTVIIILCLIAAVVGAIMCRDLIDIYRAATPCVLGFVLLAHFLQQPYRGPIYLIGFGIFFRIAFILADPLVHAPAGHPLETRDLAGYWLMMGGTVLGFVLAWDGWESLATIVGTLFSAFCTSKRALASSLILAFDVVGIGLMIQYMQDNVDNYLVVMVYIEYVTLALLSGLFFFVAAHLQDTKSVKLVSAFVCAFYAYYLAIWTLFAGGPDKLKAGRAITFASMCLMCAFHLVDVYDGEYDRENGLSDTVEPLNSH